MSLTDSTVSGNSSVAHGGGGIFNNSNGTLTLERVTISQNATPDFFNGGGIWNNGNISVTDSTISGNTSNNSIGGIANQGTAAMTNTTVSGNIGTGILNSAAAGANIMLANCTITHNTDAGITNWQTATLKNTIVAHNALSDCSDPVTSDGYNLDSDNTCNLSGTGDSLKVEMIKSDFGNFESSMIIV